MQDLPRVYEVRKPDNLPENAIKIGEQQHEVLEITPAKAYVKVIILQAYKIPDSANGVIIVTPPTPDSPLPKCIAGATVIAQLLVDKFYDHIPVIRQLGRFKRNGVSLPYNTALDLTGKGVDMLEVFVAPLKKRALDSAYIHVDETGLKVLIGKESTNKKNKHVHGGFLWCYQSSIENFVLFDYRPGRGEEHTYPILKDFKCIIQTDGWQVYQNVDVV